MAEVRSHVGQPVPMTHLIVEELDVGDTDYRGTGPLSASRITAHSAGGSEPIPASPVTNR